MILRGNIDKYKSILEPDTTDLKKENNKYYQETPSNISLSFKYLNKVKK